MNTKLTPIPFTLSLMSLSLPGFTASEPQPIYFGESTVVKPWDTGKRTRFVCTDDLRKFAGYSEVKAVLPGENFGDSFQCVTRPSELAKLSDSELLDLVYQDINRAGNDVHKFGLCVLSGTLKVAGASLDKDNDAVIDNAIEIQFRAPKDIGIDDPLLGKHYEIEHAYEHKKMNQGDANVFNLLSSASNLVTTQDPDLDKALLKHIPALRQALSTGKCDVATNFEKLAEKRGELPNSGPVTAPVIDAWFRGLVNEDLRVRTKAHEFFTREFALEGNALGCQRLSLFVGPDSVAPYTDQPSTSYGRYMRRKEKLDHPEYLVSQDETKKWPGLFIGVGIVGAAELAIEENSAWQYNGKYGTTDFPFTPGNYENRVVSSEKDGTWLLKGKDFETRVRIVPNEDGGSTLTAQKNVAGKQETLILTKGADGLLRSFILAENGQEPKEIEARAYSNAVDEDVLYCHASGNGKAK